MELNQGIADNRTPLFLTESLRARAELLAAEQGSTLNELVNDLLGERIAHIEWLKTRRRVSSAELAEARRILSKPDCRSPEPGDELPEAW